MPEAASSYVVERTSVGRRVLPHFGFRLGSPLRRQEAIAGYLCILPWLLGFVILSAGPIVMSFVLMVMRWEVITPPAWSGLDNFDRQIHDPLVPTSLWNTLLYALLSVPHGSEFEFPIRWIPDQIAWDNYVRAFTQVKTLTFLRNTLIVSLVSLVGELLTASLAAYGFARLRFPGRNVLFVLMLSTLMLPYIVTLIPLFVLFRQLGWINTLLPLTVPALFCGHPLFIFLLRQTYLGLPRDLDEAARIDGAGFFRTWGSVLLPLTKPALATVAILSLVFHWNDFVAPLVYLNSQDNFTLALGVRLFRDQYRTFFNLTMAFSTMMSLPIILVFFIFQKHFVRGIAMSGLTGR